MQDGGGPSVAENIAGIVAAMIPLLTLFGAGIWQVTKYLIDTAADLIKNKIKEESKKTNESIQDISLQNNLSVSAFISIEKQISEIRSAVKDLSVTDRLIKKDLDLSLDEFRFEVLKAVRLQIKDDVARIESEFREANDFWKRVKATIEEKKKKGPNG